MTFYEAALRVLESEGRPLHFQEITEKSIAQNLLSHVGKMPEQTMLSRLAAMARRTRDRRVMVTAKDTFALTDWSLPENAEALAATGGPPENEEDSLPPLRSPERHPEPRADLVRSSGRSERKRRPDEDEGRNIRRRRYPPVAEVAFELLSEADAGITAEALLERARSRELASDELSSEDVLTALLEDNQRRIDAGRRPQFNFAREGRLLFLEKAGSPSELAPAELQAAFAEALGIPLEGGRPVLPKRSSVSSLETEDFSALFSAAKAAVKEARRATARELGRKLAKTDIAALEKSVVRLLHGLSFRELKVAKRSKDGPLMTARRREGSVELRYAVRILRASAPLDRKTVQDLRRDLGHYSAQVGLLLSAQELRADARAEAQNSGALVLLWCGDALGDKFLEAKVGVRSAQLELYELDEAFFEQARKDGEEAQRRREERQRHRHETQESGESPRLTEGGAAAHEAEPFGPGDSSEEPDRADEGSDESRAFEARPGGAEAPAGTLGGGRRRRRRRRGRRGRGARPENAPPTDVSASGDSSPGAPEASPAPPPVSSPEGGAAG